MPEVLAALDAFVQEHRRCGELEGGLEGGTVWLGCSCGAELARSARAPADGRRGRAAEAGAE